MKKKDTKLFLVFLAGIAMVLFSFISRRIGGVVPMALFLIGCILLLCSFIIFICVGLPTNKKGRLIEIALRVILSIFAMFLFLYGICLTFVTPSIDPSSIEAIKAAKRNLRIIGIPYLIFGGVIFALLIFNNILWCSKFKGNSLLKYGIVVIILCLLFSVVFIVTAIIAKNASMMIIGLIPSLFMLLYGINIIVKYKKSTNNLGCN